MKHGISAISVGLFLAISAIIILVFICVVRCPSRITEEHNAFVMKCEKDGGVTVPSQNGDICIPRWIIYGEKNR